MNAAAWFGAAVFFTFGAEPATTSQAMRELIGTNNFPYYSFAIGNIVASPFFHLHVACSLVAVLYLIAEWLYFGKYPPRRWLMLVGYLVLLGCFRGFWVQPALRSLHQIEHGRQSRPEDRQVALRAFRTWSAIGTTLDVLFVASLGFYVWRVGNPSDPTRFVSSTKFRG